jgi:phosphohistidine swiveling domain-containing protein
MDLQNLLKTKNSLIDWFRDTNHEVAEEFIMEDGNKRPRLRFLHKNIGLPIETMREFTPNNIIHNSPAFKSFFAENKDQLCAIRCVPLVKGLPKPRMRGNSIAETVPWFLEQKLDPSKYRIEVIDHPSIDHYGTIFVVNQNGIFGEIVKGGHHQLTFGFFTGDKPIAFSYDFNEWTLSEENEEVKKHLQEIVKFLQVDDEVKRQQVTGEFGTPFTQNHMTGYFETTTSEHGVWFIDYNRVLGKMFASYKPEVHHQDHTGLTGNTVCPGKATGVVRIVSQENISSAVFNEGDILVTQMTTPEFVPLMQKAAAIVTDLGGILSHAAIVSRELKKPCIVGTENATSELKEGDVVEVDAKNGVIMKV